jgi:alcohol dehydrogenase
MPNALPFHERVLDYQPRTRIVFGKGVSEKVGEYVSQLGGKRVLLVSDPGIVKAGLVDPIQESLRAAGCEVTLFQEVHENPTTEDVDACLKVARPAKVDLIVGLGGGSSLDTAKGCNFLLTNGGRMRDYWGHGKATHPMLPLIAIPTTAGTGSECQSYALIMDPETHAKMACGDPKNAAAVALLDPQLTLTQPREVTACTGIDALSHALESAVTLKRTPISSAFSREAWKLLREGFPRVLADGKDLEARAMMQLGAAFAGMAIENSMLGGAHATANPLTSKYGTLHGVAVGVMLPTVIRFNGLAEETRKIYQDLWDHPEVENPAERIASWVEDHLKQAGMPSSLCELGVPEEEFPELAQLAKSQWTGTFNPRPLEVADFERLYASASSPTPEALPTGKRNRA